MGNIVKAQKDFIHFLKKENIYLYLRTEIREKRINIPNKVLVQYFNYTSAQYYINFLKSLTDRKDKNKLGYLTYYDVLWKLYLVYTYSFAKKDIISIFMDIERDIHGANDYINYDLRFIDLLQTALNTFFPKSESTPQSIKDLINFINRINVELRATM